MIRRIQEENEKINANVELLKALKKLIPNAIGKDGSIDVDTIRYWAQKATGDKSLVTEERETFNFLGKDYARLLYSLDTETVIVPDKENNKKSENKDSENLYLSGDNLEVLKHLRRSYEGQVKCIYIDPPYNTGSDDFVYNDSFDFSEKDIEEKLGINSDSESAKRIHKMISRKSSRSHAAWLTFMYPRLKLARDLMKDDGVIFISIDDNEQANLKILCDEIFGEENFVNHLAWVSNITGRQISGSGAAQTWESILVYAKDIENLDVFSVNIDFAKSKMNDAYKGFKQDIREDDRGDYAIGDTLYNHNRKFNEESRKNLVFSIFYNPNNESFQTGNIGEVKKGFVEIQPHKNGDGVHKYHAWRWSKEKIERESYDLIALPTKKGSYEIHTKIRDFTRTTLKDIITNIQNGDDEVQELFDKRKYFSYPKSTTLLKVLLESLTYSNDSSIFLDFFSGSGTTAHSVMNLNIKGSQHKFIAVQLPENLDIQEKTNETTKNAIKFLDSINKPHTLDQIGMERIRRAAKKIKEENPDYQGDLGFKHFTIQKPAQKSIDKITKFDIGTNIGDASILKEFGTETVLATWMVNDGHTFNAQVETIDLKGYKAFRIKDYLYLIDEGISNENIKSLFQKYDEDSSFKPKHIVAFGYSFGMTTLETLKANIKGISDINIQLEVRY